MPFTIKTERSYLEALNDIGDIDDPDVKADVQAAIKDYELAKSTPLGTPGIEGFERSTGMSLPSDRKTRDAERAPLEKRPPVLKGSLLSTINRPTWYEPTLEEFQAEMRPVLGEEVTTITEDSPRFQRYADEKWTQAYDAAEANGESLLRVRDIPTDHWAGKAVKAAAEFERYAKPVQHAVEEGITGGLVGNARARFNEATGLDRNAVEELERERARLGPEARIAGNIAGVLMPGSVFNVAGKAASKLIAPAAGALIVKGGGKAIPRALGRGAVAATAGGAGMAAQGAAEDIAREGIAEGTNPFSLDFLGRRAKDFGIGAAGGVGSEVLGAGVARLGRRGEISRAQDIRAEGALSKKSGVNPVLEAMGATPATLAELQQVPMGSLVAAALAGNGLGRYMLLTRLGNKAVQSGESGFKAMAAKFSAAPLPPDVIGAIRERMVTRGAEVFGGRARVPGTHGSSPNTGFVRGQAANDLMPPTPAQAPKTGSGSGGMFGIPFTGGAAAAQPTTLSPKEAEAFILNLIEEDRLEQEKMESVGEEDEEAPLDETDDSGETSSIGLPPAITGEEVLPEMELGEDVGTTPTTASMNTRENALAEDVIEHWDDHKESDDYAIVEDDPGSIASKKAFALEKSAEDFAKRSAPPGASPMLLFLLKTKYLQHHRQFQQNVVADRMIQEDKQLNPQHYKSTEKGRRQAQEIEDQARRGDFRTPSSTSVGHQRNEMTKDKDKPRRRPRFYQPPGNQG